MFNTLILLTVLCLSGNAQTLKSATASGWGGYVGTEMNAGNMRNDYSYKQKAAEQYNMAVAEYECKFTTQYAKGQWGWDDCDYIYNWAKENSMTFRFHALIWNIYNPQWLQNNEGGSGATYLRTQMRIHIEEAMNRYPNVQYWDVVNEAIKDDLSSGTCSTCNIYKQYAKQGNDGWQEDRWYDINKAGGNYVKEAFEIASSVNSNVKLFYNDYNILSSGSHYYEPKATAVYNILSSTNWMKSKSTAVYNMIKDLKNQGVKIDGIGFQSHISATDDSLNYAGIKANFDRFADLGLEIHVTEIDVNNPNNDQNALAETYKMVLDACMDTSACKAFVSWGYTDRYTWIGSSNNPLPFEDDLSAKTTVYTLIDALQSGSGGGSSSSGNSGSSGSSSSGGGQLVNWGEANQYWYAMNVISDNWITKVEVQGSNWGSSWSSCGYKNVGGDNIWMCTRVGSKLFTSLPLNVRITDRDGAVSNSYYVIKNLNEGSTYYMASFSSSFTEDDDGAFLADSSYNAAEIVSIIVIVLIGCVIMGIIGYCCIWKRHRNNEKFDREKEDKMMSIQQEDTPRDSNEMEEEIEIDVEVNEVTQN